MTRLSNYLLALCLLVFGVPALAACPAQVSSDKACVQWLPSTTWSDGTAYAAGTVVTYTVYTSDGQGGGVLLATTTANDVTIPGLPPGQHCFVVYATVNGLRSGPSNSPCKTIRFAGPSDGTIVGPSDGSIEPGT
jgi:hypothetical protein